MDRMLKEYSTQFGKVRHFSNPRIQDQIDAVLKHVSADKPVAVVGHVTNQGWKMSAAARIGDDWTIMAGAFKDWDVPDSFTVEGQILWTP